MIGDSLIRDWLIRDWLIGDWIIRDSLFRDSLVVDWLIRDSLVRDSLIIDWLIWDSLVVDSLIRDSLFYFPQKYFRIGNKKGREFTCQKWQIRGFFHLNSCLRLSLLYNLFSIVLILKSCFLNFNFLCITLCFLNRTIKFGKSNFFFL